MKNQFLLFLALIWTLPASAAKLACHQVRQSPMKLNAPVAIWLTLQVYWVKRTGKVLCQAWISTLALMQALTLKQMQKLLSG